MIINLNKNKWNVGIAIFVLVSLLVTGYIFYNSLQKAEDSDARSDKVVEQIQPIVDPDEKIAKEDMKKYTRKVAHFIEFTMLGISVGCVFGCVYGKIKKVFVSLPLFLTLFVGVVDEFIQKFGDRASRVSDVLIDFSGACIGLLFVFIVIVMYKNITKKRNVKC
ncbi:MAG: VanZ family protein [Clostridia bacterium]|nr:VanZ family protein [Clostridia bacterium]